MGGYITDFQNGIDVFVQELIEFTDLGFQRINLTVAGWTQRALISTFCLKLAFQFLKRKP
jgi:hypothetical protein